MRSAMRRRVLGRQRERLVERVRVQRLRAAARPPTSAWIATRTTLFSGCCAVSVEPPVCAWKRSASAFGFVAPKRSRMIRAHSRRAARNFATSWKKSLCALKKNESRSPNSSGDEPGVDRRLAVRDARSRA